MSARSARSADRLLGGRQRAAGERQPIKVVVPRGGALQFTYFNDLARGGTVSRSVPFRDAPGASVPPFGLAA